MMSVSSIDWRASGYQYFRAEPPVTGGSVALCYSGIRSPYYLATFFLATFFFAAFFFAGFFLAAVFFAAFFFVPFFFAFFFTAFFLPAFFFGPAFLDSSRWILASALSILRACAR